MARYDVRAGDDGNFYLDVQHGNLSHLNTRVVVPLMAPDQAPLPSRQLNPVFVVKGQTLVMVTQYIAAVRLVALGPVVATLNAEHDRISDALDRLFHGF